jgi:hypothetical protein
MKQTKQIYRYTATVGVLSAHKSTECSIKQTKQIYRYTATVGVLSAHKSTECSIKVHFVSMQDPMVMNPPHVSYIC